MKTAKTATRTQRLIEVDFPIREVSEQSVREKNIRHGHISTLHIWWARRPLAACRTTALAALLPDDPKRRNEFLKLIKEIAPWEQVSNGPSPNTEKARKLIREAFGGRAPKVLDCFAGGGAIPLEALRLGCETYALDYNPVAVLINKAVLEFPQRFGKSVAQSRQAKGELFESEIQTVNPLLEAVKRWGNWVLEEARKELEIFYPKDKDGSIPVGYIWARTLPCQNPECGAEIPLMRQTWLAKKEKKKVALKLIPDKRAKRVNVSIVEGKAIDFDPEEGTIQRAHARCPVCNGAIDDDTTRQLFREGKSGQRMVTVVLHHPNRTGKTYRLPTEQDLNAYQAAEAALKKERAALQAEWGMDPVPDEPVPLMSGVFNVPIYGLTRWGDLFNARQKLALITFAEKVRQVHARMVKEDDDPEFAKAVVTYLTCAFDRLADQSTVLVPWITQLEAVAHTFNRQALGMVWDYVEASPLIYYPSAMDWIERILTHLTPVLEADAVATVLHGSATELPWPDNFFDAVLTDPPYYINVPYADLSDFFYVWLKRTIGDLYPELFATPTTPKSQEICQMQHWDPQRYAEKDQTWFEQMLTQAFLEINRVLKPDGIAVIVFAYPKTGAWEAVINAVLGAGLYLTASWPLHTEMQARLRAQETASLASSIYMVCRKRTADEAGEFSNVRREIGERVQQKLAQFWEAGIRGADFFMSAIGPAVEAFGKYSKVERLSGEEVKVPELLSEVRRVVSEFALERILKQAELGGVDAPTRFYLLYRWTYNQTKVHFDEARKLSQGVGVELADLWQPGGIVLKEKEYVRVPSPSERARDASFSRRSEFRTMIDALHRAVAFWERNEQKKLNEHLSQTYGGNEAFWQVAQAIAEVLPEGDKERQLVQGLLYGRKRYISDERQSELFAKSS